MNITLRKADINDAQTLHEMQIKSFIPLLEKYRDFDTSPANEPLEKIILRISQPITDYYIIQSDDTPVGGIRIVKLNNNQYRISPIFILPEYQGNGIAQEAFHIAERIYADAKAWKLDTILQEKGNCHLYEKLGYRQTGEFKPINEEMTIAYYEKRYAE